MKTSQAKSLFVNFGVCLSLAIGLTALSALAQSATSPPPEQALKTKTELVKLDVTVLDTDGNFVDGLKDQNFHIFDNGAERPILYFAPVTDAAKVVVVLETSPSVYLIKDEHIAAAYALLKGLSADDEVALVTYSDLPRAVMPFTTNKAELLTALGSAQYMIGSGALNLYYTVSDVVDGLARFRGKKAIVLLTTGLDSSPPSQWTELTQKLRASDVVIFSVGLLGPLANSVADDQKGSKHVPGASAFDSGDLQSNPALKKADQDLTELATMTGGQAYFPMSSAEFAPAYLQIAACLRNEYVIGIAPDHDGQFHRLSVTVADSDNALLGKKKHKKKKKKHGEAEYRVSFRQGYIAPAS
ncbi:MAG TPA: VWA domain-containing protein [Candidatus Acidoferrum sp.]|nr:VWA domain-containing protein [Candidatus Acidoferrum sp.]